MPDKFKLIDNTQEGLEEMSKNMENALDEINKNMEDALKEMNPDSESEEEEELLEDVIEKYLKDLE